MHDIEAMSIEALAELRDAVTARLADRVAARQKELQAEQDRIGGLVDAKPKSSGKRPVKYRSGSNEWSGAGSQPAWVKAHLAAGGTLDQLKA